MNTLSKTVINSLALALSLNITTSFADMTAQHMEEAPLPTSPSAATPLHDPGNMGMMQSRPTYGYGNPMPQEYQQPGAGMFPPGPPMAYPGWMNQDTPQPMGRAMMPPPASRYGMTPNRPPANRGMNMMGPGMMGRMPSGYPQGPGGSGMMVHMQKIMMQRHQQLEHRLQGIEARLDQLEQSGSAQ